MTQVDQCETEREACWKANVTATENLIKGCAATGAHLVHVSQTSYSMAAVGRWTKTEKPAPVNYYGRASLPPKSAL